MRGVRAVSTDLDAPYLGVLHQVPARLSRVVQTVVSETCVTVARLGCGERVLSEYAVSTESGVSTE